MKTAVRDRGFVWDGSASDQGIFPAQLLSALAPAFLRQIASAAYVVTSQKRAPGSASLGFGDRARAVGRTLAPKVRSLVATPAEPAWKKWAPQFGCPLPATVESRLPGAHRTPRVWPRSLHEPQALQENAPAQSMFQRRATSLLQQSAASLANVWESQLAPPAQLRALAQPAAVLPDAFEPPAPLPGVPRLPSVHSLSLAALASRRSRQFRPDACRMPEFSVKIRSCEFHRLSARAIELVHQKLQIALSPGPRHRQEIGQRPVIVEAQ